MSGKLARLLIWAAVAIAIGGGAADAQLGGTMLARQARSKPVVCTVLLTGGGVQLTGGGVNLCE